MPLAGCYKFFRSRRETHSARIQEAAARVAKAKRVEYVPTRVGTTEQEFLDILMEFEAKIGPVDRYSIGQVMDMLAIRYEELQITWACSAQNPDLLPKNMKRNSGKAGLQQHAGKHFK